MTHVVAPSKASEKPCVMNFTPQFMITTVPHSCCDMKLQISRLVDKRNTPPQLCYPIKCIENGYLWKDYEIQL